MYSPWGNTFKTNKLYIAILQERALKCIILNTNINIHDFMQSNFIFKFDDIVKFNSIKCIHRGFYDKLQINLQIRLIKNKNVMVFKNVIHLLERHLELLETYFV